MACSIEALPEIKAKLEENSADGDTTLELVSSVRKLLSRERDAPINEVITAGFVPLFVEIATDSPDERTQVHLDSVFSCLV